MNELAAIEAINFEQLATATDRLLLRGRFAARRASSVRIVGRTSRELAGRTLFMRRAGSWRTFTYAALITGLFSVSASIASLL